MSRLRSCFHRLFRFGEILALITLVLLTVTISCDVVGRYLFHLPLQGAVELGELFMIPIVYIAMANSQRLGLFVRVTMVTDRMSPRGRLWTDLISHVLSLIFWAFVLLASWDSAQLAWNYSDVTPGLMAIPLFPAKIAIPFGVAMLMIQLLFDCVDSLKALSHGQAQAGPDQATLQGGAQ